MKLYLKNLTPLLIFLLPLFVMVTQVEAEEIGSLRVDLEVTCINDSCTLPGCTDPSALNYDAAATYDDGSCSYPNGGPNPTQTPPPAVVRGCTDSSAKNFNPLAGEDDGSCQYDTAIPNVSNFKLSKVASGIRLTWSNPDFDDDFSVVIVKSIDSIPADSSDGEIIYNSQGTSVSDENILSGRTYYFLALVRDDQGNFSSGALVSYRDGLVTGCTNTGATNFNPLATEDDGSCIFPEGRGCTDSTASNYNPRATENDGSCIYPPPFEEEERDSDQNEGKGDYRSDDGFVGSGPSLPFDNLITAPLSTSSEQRIENFRVKNELFILKQPGERTKPFVEGGEVKIKGNKILTFSVDYYKMPEVLKAIGVTLVKRNDPDKSLSFLMKLNHTRTAYEATIGPLDEDGVYLASIYLINYQDQSVKKFSGQILAVGSLGFLGAGSEKLIKNFAGPVAISGGVTAGFFQVLFTTGHIGSFADVYWFLFRQLGIILSLLGIKKKNKPWGTVYDSITKRPIDPAYITIKAGDEEVATAITDIDGRFGFSLLDGDYSLNANKTHYQFPSALLAGRAQDEVYNNLYFGEQMHLAAGEVVTKNIPLDPIGFDWNEFVKRKGDYFKTYTSREVLRSKIFYWIYCLGLLMSIFYLIFYPSILNILIPLSYLAVNVGGRYWSKKHRVVTILNTTTGEPVSFGIVRIYYADLDQEIKKVVADMVGRFYLLVRPGTYYLTVDHKQPDGTYARIYKSPVTELKRGVWTEDILI